MLILIAAGVISILLNEIMDGMAILSVALINAIIGFIQEYKAENAVKALKDMVIPTTIVIRDNEQKEIDVRELTIGDAVLLFEGDKIPADLKIIESFSLKIDESILTGESIAVGKNAKDQLFKETLVVSGKAKAIVEKIGIDTEFGKIVNLVSKAPETKSPLTIQLDNLGKKLGLIIITTIAIIFIIGELRNFSMLESFLTSISLGVSAIPEGMPIIVTLTLAIGMQKMARQKAIVRKMSAIETLGATTIICSDKTGTLTANEMTVKKIHTNLTEKDIRGSGYDISEKIKMETTEEKKLLEICENCNNSFMGKSNIGDPTEIALKVLAEKANFIKEYEELDENPFTSERKMMSTLHKIGNKKEMYAKGAFEEIIKNCKFILKGNKITKITSADIEKFAKKTEEYGQNALRVLAFAFKKDPKNFNEKDLIFVGIVGIIDPLRKTVKSSMETAKLAGIKVKMITGDNLQTAKAIGKSLGFNISKALTGEEIDKLNDKKLKKAIYETDIFARTKPEHKYRIINLLRKNNEVVAVTGDGINDAPALKQADVGIAMGIKGTQATKEVSDIVLKDDNFTTIINAIKEGRRIYNNILSFIKYMLSVNFDEIATVAIATILGYPLPLLPLQILWINIATDSLPALALGNSPAKEDIMTIQPHPKNENIFKKFQIFILIAALVQTIANLSIYFYGTIKNLPIDLIRSMVFTEIVLFELVFVPICKEGKKYKFSKSMILSILIPFLAQLMIIYIPSIQRIFNTTSIGFKEWILLIIFTLPAFLIPKLTNITKKLFNHAL